MINWPAYLGFRKFKSQVHGFFVLFLCFSFFNYWGNQEHFLSLTLIKYYFNFKSCCVCNTFWLHKMQCRQMRRRVPLDVTHASDGGQYFFFLLFSLSYLEKQKLVILYFKSNLYFFDSNLFFKILFIFNLIIQF